MAGLVVLAARSALLGSCVQSLLEAVVFLLETGGLRGVIGPKTLQIEKETKKFPGALGPSVGKSGK